MEVLCRGEDNVPIIIQHLEIPGDICTNIITLLSVLDVCSLGACSRQWHLLCSSNIVWHILYQKRWHPLNSSSKLKGGEVYDVKRNGLLTLEETNTRFKGWRATYIHLHKQMASGATTIVEYVKARACYDSLEVTEYQKAMALLISVGLQFSDVQIFLLAAKHSVLVNLLGIHYCLLQLKIQSKDVREALLKNNIGERQVCLRWWSLGCWRNGFRRHDEMHMRIASLINLTELEPRLFLEVINRGILHEILRVQISADFESSAWVARSMHSQR